jgi:hypothetical protein
VQDTEYELKLLNTYCLKILHLIEVTKEMLNTHKTAKTQNLLLQDKREVYNSVTTSNPEELNKFNYQKDIRRRKSCKTLISETTRHIRCGRLVCAPASYSRGAGFKSRGKFPFWLRFSCSAPSVKYRCSTLNYATRLSLRRLCN